MIHDVEPLITQLGKRLHQTRAYWQFKPFEHHHLPFPEPLASWLWQQSDASIERLNTDANYAAEQFQPWLPEPIQWRAELEQQLAAPKQRANKPIPFWLSSGISGRKLAQIQAFTEQLRPPQGLQLEWCAGKGHLGRLLQYEYAQPVRSLEWQPQLSEAGQALARQHGIDQTFVCADVLSPDVDAQLSDITSAVALHACGDLHTQLIRRVIATKVPYVQLAPCCYPLQQASRYRPCSRAAAATELALSRFDLKLAVQGQMTGGERIRVLREREIQWRLGYESWRRTYTGGNEYLPLSTFPKALLSGNFSEFVSWAATQHQLAVGSLTRADTQAHEAAGIAHWRAVQRMDAVRRVFGRLLEIWLVLDRASWLHEAGYDVAVFTFCEPQLTPRNLCIQAVHPRLGSSRDDKNHASNN